MQHTRNGIKDEKNKIIMLWTPRAACTVSLHMMFEHMGIVGIMDETMKSHQSIQEYRRNVFYEKYGRVDRKDLCKDYFIFKVIRNPYARAVSSYSFDPCRDNSFYDFLQILKKYNLKYVDGMEINKLATYHAIPQYIKGEEQYVNAYIKIENGQDEIDSLINIPFGFNFKINDKTSSHHAKRTDISSFVGYTSKKAKGPVQPQYKNFYNDEIKKLVDELYGDDINNYGYKFDDIFV